MTIKERDKQAYEFYNNRVIKLQETLDTGILNEESREVLRNQLSNAKDNAYRYKKVLNAHGFKV